MKKKLLCANFFLHRYSQIACSKYIYKYDRQQIEGVLSNPKEGAQSSSSCEHEKEAPYEKKPSLENLCVLHSDTLSRYKVTLVYTNEEQSKSSNAAKEKMNHLGTLLLIGAQILTLAQPYELAEGSMDEQ